MKRKLHDVPLSDFDVSIDDTFLTSEPEPNAANSIEQIAKIAKVIGAKLGSENTTTYKKEKQGDFLIDASNSLLSWRPYVSLEDTIQEMFGPLTYSANQGAATFVGQKSPSSKGKKKEKLKQAGMLDVGYNLERAQCRKPAQRSKHGCWTCRLRHKACPEDGHPCGACSRLGLECDVSRQRPSYMVDARQAMERLKEIRAVTNQLRKLQKVVDKNLQMAFKCSAR